MPLGSSSPVLAGLMQDVPLQICSIIRHAAAINARHEVVSREPSGTIRRSDYGAVEARSRRLAHGLSQLGIREGDRVATLAWNGCRHLEMFYGVPASGAVLHTVNPRFGDDQIVYTLNHAADRILAFDADLLTLVERIAPQLGTIEHFVLLGAELPASVLPLMSYEALLGDLDYTWPALDERAAALLCYTSGTTGRPKGVLTSHRSTVIHALAAQSGCALGLTPEESVLLSVPMFHAFGWGLPYVAAIAGAKLILPGPLPDSATLAGLIQDEGATLAMGVPTVWSGILDHLAETGGTLGSLRRALIGGSAVPPPIERRLHDHGVTAVTGWGMTEMSPLGSFSGSARGNEPLPADDRQPARTRSAGRLLYPLEVSLRQADGAEVPADGVSAGHVWVRSPCVAAAYFRGDDGALLDPDGWFPTGDIATLDAHGSIAIVDRAKDLIKSGGEWISSAELERVALSVRGVAQASAIAVAHPKWQERPLLLLVADSGQTIELDAVRAALAAAMPRWQHPDDIIVVDSLPLTATGKIDKKALRRVFADHLTGTAVEE